MRIRQIAAAGVAGLAAAALLALGAGAANAATTEPCPGTGPAASPEYGITARSQGRSA